MFNMVQHLNCPPNTEWNENNLLNFITQEEWSGDSPHLKCIENVWTILDSEAYKDPCPTIKTHLRHRLQQAGGDTSETLDFFNSFNAKHKKKCIEKLWRTV
jgi:hypothetical protein